MRRIVFSMFFLTVLPLVAHAQNYIPSNGYEGAGVIVNMDVLNAQAPSAPMPVMSQNLPPVAPPSQPPIVLHPPQAHQQVEQTTMAPAMPEPVSPPPAPVSEMSAESAPHYIAPSLPNPVMGQEKPVEPPSVPAESSSRQELGSLHDNGSSESASPAAAMPPPAPPISPVGANDEMAPLTAPPSIGASPSAPDNHAIQNSSAGDNFEAYRLFFDPTSDVLKPSETAVLDKIASKLNADPSWRLQVRAYAAGTADNEGAARRLSLSRALKVRDYLTQKNIAATRLDIRALGMGSAEMGDQAGSKQPPDRVDVIFSK